MTRYSIQKTERGLSVSKAENQNLRGKNGAIQGGSFYQRSITVGGTKLNRGSLIDFINAQYLALEGTPCLEKGGIFWGGSTDEDITKTLKWLKSQELQDLNPSERPESEGIFQRIASAVSSLFSSKPSETHGLDFDKLSELLEKEIPARPKPPEAVLVCTPELRRVDGIEVLSESESENESDITRGIVSAKMENSTFLVLSREEEPPFTKKELVTLLKECQDIESLHNAHYFYAKDEDKAAFKKALQELKSEQKTSDTSSSSWLNPFSWSWSATKAKGTEFTTDQKAYIQILSKMLEDLTTDMDPDKLKNIYEVENFEKLYKGEKFESHFFAYNTDEIFSSIKELKYPKEADLIFGCKHLSAKSLKEYTKKNHDIHLLTKHKGKDDDIYRGIAAYQDEEGDLILRIFSGGKTLSKKEISELMKEALPKLKKLEGINSYYIYKFSDERDNISIKTFIECLVNLEPSTFAQTIPIAAPKEKIASGFSEQAKKLASKFEQIGTPTILQSDIDQNFPTLQDVGERAKNLPNLHPIWAGKVSGNSVRGIIEVSISNSSYLYLCRGEGKSFTPLEVSQLLNEASKNHSFENIEKFVIAEEDKKALVNLLPEVDSRNKEEEEEEEEFTPPLSTNTDISIKNEREDAKINNNVRKLYAACSTPGVPALALIKNIYGVYTEIPSPQKEASLRKFVAKLYSKPKEKELIPLMIYSCPKDNTNLINFTTEIWAYYASLKAEEGINTLITRERCTQFVTKLCPSFKEKFGSEKPGKYTFHFWFKDFVNDKKHGPAAAFQYNFKNEDDMNWLVQEITKKFPTQKLPKNCYGEAEKGGFFVRIPFEIFDP